ncbi:MAG: CoA transferase [Dehalococcoidia bacterium]|nr:CoA transferase [Dehalococcoidia bacterium]
MLPLEGIRILDMSRLPPCSQATMYLADMGAEVIKIEATAAAGERAVGYASEPSPPMTKAGMRISAYNALNRNKKSLGLNLKSDDGRQIFHKLAETADVVFEGFRPGVTKRLGVDYETIRKINPKIIYCSLTGYGQTGPYASLPGHDINYIALGGALGLIGSEKSDPVIPLGFVGDAAGGTLHAVIAILGALAAREKSGVGQYIDVALTDGVVSLLGMLSVWYFQNGDIPKRGHIAASGDFPEYGVYQTKDGGYVALGAMEPYFWENVCKEVGREDLIPAPKELGKESEEIRETMRKIFLTKTRDEWFDLLAPKNIPITKVNNVAEVFSDLHIRARKMVMELDHPAFGKVKQAGFPIKYSETPLQVRHFAPFFSQNEDELLEEVGYFDDERERLRQEGVIGQPSQRVGIKAHA